MSSCLDYMLHRLMFDSSGGGAMDWLSRLFEMTPVRGRLDLRCAYGAPWRIDQGPGEANEIPYHAVLDRLRDPGGSGGGPTVTAEGRRHSAASRQPTARHARRQRGRAPAGPQPRVPQPHDQRKSRFGRTLDLLCGHFAIAPPHDRLLRSYLPPRLVVHAGAHTGQRETPRTRWPRLRRRMSPRTIVSAVAPC